MKGGERIAWKYDYCRCGCGIMETEMHVLFECTLSGEERERWRGAVGDLKDSDTDSIFRRTLIWYYAEVMVWINMK